MICSLVSQQFERSCCKHLFSYIELNIPYTICHFHALLLENPNLAVLVRYLCIYAEGPRFGSDLHLPWILGMLTCLQWLEIGNESLSTTDWKCLSREAQSALMEICQSPSLSILDISHAVGLPPALLKNTRVRKLGVQYVSTHEYHTPVMELDFTGLEALDICVAGSLAVIKNRSLDLYTGTTDSRQLSIRTYPDSCQLMLEIVHNVMEKASQTLKHVSWQKYQKRNRDLCAITYCWYPAPQTQQIHSST